MKNYPQNRLQFPISMRYRCAWPGAVLKEHTSSPVGQRWPLLSDCFLQTVQLLTIQFRIKCFVVGDKLIVGDSLAIPTNTDRRRLNAIGTWPFSLHFVVSDPLFVRFDPMANCTTEVILKYSIFIKFQLKTFSMNRIFLTCTVVLSQTVCILYKLTSILLCYVLPFNETLLHNEYRHG